MSPSSAPARPASTPPAPLLAGGADVDLIERLPTPVGARPPRRRARPSRDQGRLARLREDRRRSPASASSATSRSGTTVTHAELAALYDAVVYTVGAQTDRAASGIPGEDLPGSWPATEFVAWYNGHPDFQELDFDLSGERAVVVGNGNVAVDVARMLALTHEELAPTDTTDAAIAAIAAPGSARSSCSAAAGPLRPRSRTRS